MQTADRGVAEAPRQGQKVRKGCESRLPFSNLLGEVDKALRRWLEVDHGLVRFACRW